MFFGIGDFFGGAYILDFLILHKKPEPLIFKVQCFGIPYDSGDAGSGSDSSGTGESGTLTLPEYIYATYNELMKNGWRMMEIDEMDMLGFLRLRAWDAQREHEKKKPRQRFIDEVWPGLKP